MYYSYVTQDSRDDARLSTHHGLTVSRGIGKQVKKTVPRRKGFLPHTSDRAPMSGALRKESRPWRRRKEKPSQSSDAFTVLVIPALTEL